MNAQGHLFHNWQLQNFVLVMSNVDSTPVRVYSSCHKNCIMFFIVNNIFLIPSFGVIFIKNSYISTITISMFSIWQWIRLSISSTINNIIRRRTSPWSSGMSGAGGGCCCRHWLLLLLLLLVSLLLQPSSLDHPSSIIITASSSAPEFESNYQREHLSAIVSPHCSSY